MPGQSYVESSDRASADDAANVAAFLGGEARAKAPREIGNILAARAQRRNADREHVEPVKQILAKLPALHLLDQILIGGRDQPDIDAHRPLRADRVDLALLQRAQQLDLQIERQFADFVEKQRAAIGLDEFSDVFFGGAGEGALLVAE